MLLAASPVEDPVENHLGKAWKKEQCREMLETILVGILHFAGLLPSLFWEETRHDMIDKYVYYNYKYVKLQCISIICFILTGEGTSEVLPRCPLGMDPSGCDHRYI